MKPSICWVAMVASAKLARFRHVRLMIENQTSIQLNQEACTGKKWNTNVRCGWLSNQLATSASRSFIQVSKTVQANLVPLEDDADGAFTGAAQAKFGMGSHVLGEVLDAPVGLAGTGRVDLLWFLTGQHQQPGLDVGGIQTGRRTLGTVFEAVQAVLGKAVAPQVDGAFGETHVSGDSGIGLTCGD